MYELHNIFVSLEFCEVRLRAHLIQFLWKSGVGGSHVDVRKLTDTLRAIKNLTWHGHAANGVIYVLAFWATNPLIKFFCRVAIRAQRIIVFFLIPFHCIANRWTARTWSAWRTRRSPRSSMRPTRSSPSPWYPTFCSSTWRPSESSHTTEILLQKWAKPCKNDCSPL